MNLELRQPVADPDRPDHGVAVALREHRADVVEAGLLRRYTMYACVCVHTYIYIYIYTQGERERERERV